MISANYVGVPLVALVGTLDFGRFRVASQESFSVLFNSRADPGIGLVVNLSSSDQFPAKPLLG